MKKLENQYNLDDLFEKKEEKKDDKKEKVENKSEKKISEEKPKGEKQPEQ